MRSEGNQLIEGVQETIRISREAGLAAEIEALLVNRVGDANDVYLVPFDLALRLADEADGALPHKISITQREISQMIGVSRESINKHLRSWAQANWVVLERGTIVVLQPDALAVVAREGLESQFA
jgi:CRP-like cAMP-binding protein